jgi:IS1 family transposase
MNQLSTADRAKVIAALVEGNSLRATSRMTGVARMTVEKLLRDMGAACQRFHDETVRNLKTKRVQCDEIWSFCYAKNRNVTPEILERNPDAGDVWTWTALDADSKLAVAWLVGDRNLPTAYAFLRDVAGRLTNRIQLTTDGYHVYLNAVEEVFGDIDYATVTKIYSSAGDGRFSPGKLRASQRATIKGHPDAGHISTSYVERQNLTMRMHMRRFTRLTNAFTRKVEMHAHSVALHFAYYNFCKIHQTLRVTPAMEAGLSDHVWTVEDLVQLLANPSVDRATA